MEEIVDQVKEMNKIQPIEPDVQNVAQDNGTGIRNNVEDISGPIIKINNLTIDTEQILGHGSHGTMVYKGSFEGRAVAAKRMLLDFYNIASQEVSLLQESDDHKNVIRYYCQQQQGNFLYIALELCPASLQDVVEKRLENETFNDLGNQCDLDLPNVLYQITAGVRHLHSLKIVHRDLKPQNILVAPGKKNRFNPDAHVPPRLLISDFGLCKKLENDQSSFGATTANAAGTSGWRAPELLTADDGPPPQGSESIQSGSTSEPAVIDSLTQRRATRAIDIFSLGCVFFYVLTGGNHPFGDRRNYYMREGNIARGHYDLSALQSLGDCQYEATHLITGMLAREPRQRPDATAVLIHPFFWSPEKRLAFLVDVSDHFEFEQRDPPSPALQILESVGPIVLGRRMDFLASLDRSFVDTLGKQRKYTGNRMLDLLRALRNKRNHYMDMPDNVKRMVGPLPHGYLQYWTIRFPALVIQCWRVVMECGFDADEKFRKAYFEPPVDD
jgi:serine/threonine-protein kinase/endoribonuclease IRE1